MANKTNPKTNFEQPSIYEIQVEGQLDPQWSDWFEGMTIIAMEDSTLISGPVLDEAALHGILKKIRDSGLRLLSINKTATD